MGPVFGIKGGAAGGGYAQVLPMEDINLHFTGDMHAITAANNLIAAAIDNHIYWGNELNIDLENIFFKRCIDVNDRALRNIQIIDKKYSRNDKFQITVASEIMAILCLSNSLTDLKEKVGQIVFAKDINGNLLKVSQLNVQGSVAVIMKDAIKPNLVQTTENTPAIIHGGPFANIAHGCNSILATKMALKLSDYTVTEAGFAADLGLEKFFDIKCRKAGITPDMVCLVVTCRAILENGIENIKIHIENIRKFNIDIIVAINKFEDDSEIDIENIKKYVIDLGCDVQIVDSYKKGGLGAIKLASQIVEHIESREIIKEPESTKIRNFDYLYPNEMPIIDKIKKVAMQIYRASDVNFSEKALQKLAYFSDKGIDKYPVCISKTPMSLTDDPKIKTLPDEYIFNINDIEPKFGAEFVVCIAKDIIDMPGLSKNPSANIIDIDENENIINLS